jgi:hypothetical protein
MTDEKAFDGPRCALDWEFAGLVELLCHRGKGCDRSIAATIRSLTTSITFGYLSIYPFGWWLMTGAGFSEREILLADCWWLLLAGG